MYLDGSSSGQLYMSGVFSSAFPGYLPQVSPSALAERDSAPVFPANSGPGARITGFLLPVADAHFGTGLQSSFSFVLSNSEKLYLPGGEAKPLQKR